MKPLKVSDLKPGDVVRMDLVVSASTSIAQGYWRLSTGPVDIDETTNYVIVDQSDLAAGNAERVVRPRPVRKGDEIVANNLIGEPVYYTFLTFMPVWNGQQVVAARNGTVDRYTAGGFTHADGSPIDWEASE